MLLLKGTLRERFFRFSRGKIEKITPLRTPCRAREAGETKDKLI